MTTAREKERATLRTNKPEVWIAVAPGDQLTGIIDDLDVAWSDVQNNGKGDGWYPLLTVKVEQGDGYHAGQVVKVHAFSTVLRNEVLKREPMPGERVIITYIGTSTEAKKGQSPPELYRVTVPGRDPETTARKVYGQFKRPGPGQPTSDVPEPADAGDEPLPY